MGIRDVVPAVDYPRPSEENLVTTHFRVASRPTCGMLSSAPPSKPIRERIPMKKLFLILLLVPLLGWAQSPFDGTWKIDLNKTKLPKKPDVYLLQNGMYECKSCNPQVNVKAD